MRPAIFKRACAVGVLFSAYRVALFSNFRSLPGRNLFNCIGQMVLDKLFFIAL